ncbi:MAG TPA: elongation factor 1-beta [Candidatus Nanoarchaeia archaeon]|nr:elongation factor 1-beta [Candidatus Nanoarchaeia archaeon]
MGQVIITLKIMPESPSTDLQKVQEEATKKISSKGGKVGKVEFEPIGFGIKALKLIFLIDEDKGDTEGVALECQKIAGVSSAEIVDMRRSF